jgi:hypothetical protein
MPGQFTQTRKDMAVRLNQIWLDYYRERYPEKFKEITVLLKQGHGPEQFAVDMFMFVQGRTDASQKWGALVEELIFLDLGLLAKIVPIHALILGSIRTNP